MGLGEGETREAPEAGEFIKILVENQRYLPFFESFNGNFAALSKFFSNFFKFFAKRWIVVIDPRQPALGVEPRPERQGSHYIDP